MLHCTCVHYIKTYICCRIRGFFLESKDLDGEDSIFFTSTRQLFGVSSFILIFEDILKLCDVYLKLLKRKVKLILPFFWFFNGLKVHVGNMDRVIGTRGWPMEEL